MKSKKKTNSNKIQEIQDNIFRTMSADRKVEVGSKLWRLAKDLVGNKINYGYERSRSSSFAGKNFPTS